MVTKLGYIDGKWPTIYSIHTDPMGYGILLYTILHVIQINQLMTFGDPTSNFNHWISLRIPLSITRMGLDD